MIFCVSITIAMIVLVIVSGIIVFDYINLLNEKIKYRDKELYRLREKIELSNDIVKIKEYVIMPENRIMYESIFFNEEIN